MRKKILFLTVKINLYKSFPLEKLGSLEPASSVLCSVKVRSRILKLHINQSYCCCGEVPNHNVVFAYLVVPFYKVNCSIGSFLNRTIYGNVCWLIRCDSLIIKSWNENSLHAILLWNISNIWFLFRRSFLFNKNLTERLAPRSLFHLDKINRNGHIWVILQHRT